MNENRIEDWKKFEGLRVEGVTLADDGRACIAFDGGSWALLKAGRSGIDLTSFLSAGDRVQLGLMTEEECEAEIAALDARKERERVQAERDYRDEMLRRQERLR